MRYLLIAILIIEGYIFIPEKKVVMALENPFPKQSMSSVDYGTSSATFPEHCYRTNYGDEACVNCGYKGKLIVYGQSNIVHSLKCYNCDGFSLPSEYVKPTPTPTPFKDYCISDSGNIKVYRGSHTAGYDKYLSEKDEIFYFNLDVIAKAFLEAGYRVKIEKIINKPIAGVGTWNPYRGKDHPGIVIPNLGKYTEPFLTIPQSVKPTGESLLSQKIETIYEKIDQIDRKLKAIEDIFNNMPRGTETSHIGLESGTKWYHYIAKPAPYKLK